MSRIYFHSPSGKAELSGREWAYMRCFTSDLFCSSLGLYSVTSLETPLQNILNPNCYIHGLFKQVRETERQSTGTYDMRYIGEKRKALEALKTALHVTTDPSPLLYEKNNLHVPVDIFSATLNTATVVGNEALQLMARLHGQCEVHAYIEGENREWVAEIIRAARRYGIFREKMGWEAVAGFLLQTNKEPVVTSYSGERMKLPLSGRGSQPAHQNLR